jgi:ribonuclease D
VQPVLIEDRRSLLHFTSQIANESVLAVDTEFISENSYTPSLELLQIATPGGLTGLLDYRSIGYFDDDPLAQILSRRDVLKVIHSARGDLEILNLYFGAPPVNTWDTQLVLGLFGYTGRTGYSAVIQTLLGADVGQAETLSDWSRRPLSRQQLEYAADDVRYLIPLYEWQRRKLEALGRLSWAREECDRAANDVAALMRLRANEDRLFERVSGARTLDRRPLAILRELAIWREMEARGRNRPPKHIMKDEVLVELARRAPEHPRQLPDMRGGNSRQMEKYAASILAAVAKGKKVPLDQCPQLRGTDRPLTDNESALVALLSAALRAVADEHEVASTLLGTTDDLRQLVQSHVNGRTPDVRVLKGWRGTLAGDAILGVLEGRRTVRWDKRAGALLIENHSSAEAAGRE